MPLQEVALSPAYIKKGRDVLQRMKNLQLSSDGLKFLPAEDFWRTYDKAKSAQ